MASTDAPSTGDVAKVAFDLWIAISGKPDGVISQEKRQKALLLYAECLKAVAGKPFDVGAIT